MNLKETDYLVIGIFYTKIDPASGSIAGISTIPYGTALSISLNPGLSKIMNIVIYVSVGLFLLAIIIYFFYKSRRNTPAAAISN